MKLRITLFLFFILASTPLVIAAPGQGVLDFYALPSPGSTAYYSVDSMVSDGVQYIAALNQTQIHLWTETNDVFTQHAPTSIGSIGSGNIRWNPTGTMLAACAGASIKVFERSGTTLTETASLTGDCDNRISWTSDEKLVWANSTSPYVWIYDASTGAIQGQIFVSPAFADSPKVGAWQGGTRIATLLNNNVSVFEYNGSAYNWIDSYSYSGTSSLEGAGITWSDDGTLFTVDIPNNSGGSGSDACQGNSQVILSYLASNIACSFPLGTSDAEGITSFDSTGNYVARAKSTGCTSTCGFNVWQRASDGSFWRSLTVGTNVTGSTNTARDVSWDPDGGYFYYINTGVSPYLFVYKRSNDEVVKDWTFDTAGGTIAEIAASASGDFVAIGHATSPYLTIYNTSVFPRTSVASPTAPAGSAQALAWGNGSQFLAVAHGTTPFITFYERSGTTFTKLSNPANLPTGTGRGVGWTPDGSHVAVAHATTPFMTVYSRSGTTFTKLANPASLPSTTGNDAAWSPNGTMLAIGGGGGLDIYYLSGSTLIKQTAPTVGANGTVEDVEWSVDGTLLVAHSSAPYISLFKYENGVFVRAPDIPSNLNTVARIAVSWNPQGNGFLTATANTGSPSINVYSWDNVAGTAVRATVYEVPNAGTGWAEWYPGLTQSDSRIVAGATASGSSLVWYNTTFGAPPSAPTNVQAVPGNGNVVLSWNAVVDATGYPIYYATSSSDCSTIGDYTYLTTTTSLGHIHAGLTNDQTYYYCVGATTGTGGTSYADEVNATPTDNTGAPILSGRAWRGNAELQWTTGNYLPIVTFMLYRGNSTINLTEYQTFNATIQSYDDAQSPGECWYYAVQSANDTEESPLSNVLEICYRPPPPPLFGDCGAIYGADRTEDGNLVNCKETLAEEVGINPLALSILYGVILTIAISTAGYMVGKEFGFEWMGSLIAAIIGVAVSLIVGFFPIWLVAFVGVAGTAALLVFRRNQ